MTKIFFNTVKRLEPATFCVKDQDGTKASARQMRGTGFLNEPNFMLQSIMRFPELTELPFQLEKNSGIARVFENLCTYIKLK